jgi:tetratricopeptide (TPR) repeat protein
VSATLDRKLQQAAAALAAGDVARAEGLSREVLERAPRHPRALQLAASARLQQGDGAGAGELLARALEGDPNNPQLLEGLGAAALKAENFVEAERWLRRAIGLGKAGAASYTWLGLALSSQGRRSDAIEMFRQAAVAAPQDPGMHFNLGNELMQSEAWEDAVTSYERALRLKPDYPEALNGLGAALKVRGELDAAAARLHQALELRPDYAEALDNLGDTLLRLERLAEAEALFRQAISLAPDNADFHADLGHVLFKQRRWSEAAAQFEHALSVRPDFHEALNSMGSALMEAGTPDAALVPIRKAIALQPGFAEAHDNLGNALMQLGREKEANESFRHAITLQPGEADHHLRYANALVSQYAWDEALAQCGHALALKPGLGDAHYAIGMVRLFRQEFDLAWEHYERRLEAKEYRKKSFRERASTLQLYERLPRWRGPGESGVREVGVWAEQGIGDEILFSTLIPELIGSGVPVRYEVDRRLLGAYQRAFPAVRFLAREEPPRAELQEASRVLLIGSLPGLFRRTRKDFARQPDKLLGALPERVAHYRQRLDALGPGLKVALAWKSTRPDWWGRKKMAQLSDLSPILKRSGAQFLDVQYGDTVQERKALEAAAGIRLARFDDVDMFNDLEDVMAIIEACDLVITTSNATAHFAGALGKRTWLLYLADRPPFHYWAHAGDHRCLWYPSVEIVTAPQITDWPSLIRHTADRLEAALQTGFKPQIDTDEHR